MQYHHQKQYRHIVRATVALLCALFLLLPASAAHAAGSATLSFGDLGEGYGVGDELAVPIEETGTGVQGAKVTFTYPQSLLRLDDIYLGAYFDPDGNSNSCPQHTGGGGVVTLNCTAASTPPDGVDSEPIAFVYFTAIAPGTATFTVTSGDIWDSSGSIWDGQLPSASVNINGESEFTGGGDTAGGTSTDDSGSAATDNSTDTGNDTTAPDQATSSGGSGTTTVTSANGKKLNLQPGKGAVLITAVDDGNQPVFGAKLTLDGKKVGYTDNIGEFEFINLDPGEHLIAAAKKGKLSTQQTFIITAGKEVQVKVHLNATPVSPLIGYISLGILCIPLLMWIYARIPVRFQIFTEHPVYHMSGIVVGSDLQAAARTDTGQVQVPSVQPVQPAEGVHVPPPLPSAESLPQTVLNPQSLPEAEKPKQQN